jgi:hypothetical protein
MNAVIVRTGIAAAIAIEARHGVFTTELQGSSERVPGWIQVVLKIVHVLIIQAMAGAKKSALSIGAQGGEGKGTENSSY